MQSLVGPRLSVMMFLQFFIWGAWYVTVGQYMATSEMRLELSIGWIYTVGPIAAILSPLFVGFIADRYFSSERVLGVLHIVGGIAMLLAPQMAQLSAGMWAETRAGMEDTSVAADWFIVAAHIPFIAIILLHMLCYMPTLGLTNSIAFHNIQNQEKQFPVIRVFGTIGWIVAGLIVSVWLSADETAIPLYTAGVAAILLGIYSFTLPHTPPPAKGKAVSIRELFGLDAMALMKERAFLVFIAASLLVCIPLAAYYAFAQLYVNHAGFHSPAGVMTFGQMSEILFMLLMPLFFVRFGVKWMLLVGMGAWVLRYGLFAVGAPDGVAWMIMMGILLHGICYDFFFVTGFIYTDKKAPKAIRAQAQSFLVLVTQGIGLGLGAQIMQRVFNATAQPNAEELGEQASALREQAEELSGAEAEAAWQEASNLLLQSVDWQTFWMIPAVFALVVMIGFALLFKDRKVEEEVTEEHVTNEDVAEAAAADEQP